MKVIAARSVAALAVSVSMRAMALQHEWPSIDLSASLRRESLMDEEGMLFLRQAGLDDIDASQMITRSIINNLGGVGPNKGWEHYIWYDNVGVLPDGKAFSLRIRNTSLYTCASPSSNRVGSDAPHFSHLNVAGSSNVRLVGEFVDADNQTVAVPTFWLAFANLSSSGNVKQVVEAKPDRFWVSSRSRSIEVGRGSEGQLHFSSNASFDMSPALLEEFLLNHGTENASTGGIVVLMYHNKSTIDLTLTVQGGPYSRNFMFAGGSQVSKTLEQGGLIPSSILPNADGSVDGPMTVKTMALQKGAFAETSHASSAQAPEGNSSKRANSTVTNQDSHAKNGTALSGDRQSVVPVTTCASTRSDGLENCPECFYTQDCACTGWVRFGYGTKWTKFQQVADYIHCNASSFGGIDPYPGHGKLCQCSVQQPLDDQVQTEELTGWWKPVIIVCGAAIPVVTLLGLAQLGLIGGSAASVLQSGASAAAGHATMLSVAFIMAAKGADSTLNSGGHSEAQESVGLIQRNTGNATAGSSIFVYPDFTHAEYINVSCYVAATFFVLQLFARLWFEDVVAKIECCQELYYRSVPQDFSEARKWRSINHLSVALMYIAMTIILAGVYFDKEVILTAAETCTYSLIFGYFGVHLVFYIVSLEVASRYAAAVAKLSALNLTFAPMVALLCMTVQIQADSVGQLVATQQEGYMFAATTLVLFQALLATLSPMLFRSHLAETGTLEREDLVVDGSRGFLLIFGLVRWFIILYLYYTCYRLVSGLWSRAAGTSEERTKWVDAFMFAYFAANTIQWTVLTLRQCHCVGPRSARFAYMFQHLVDPIPVFGALLVGWWLLTPDAVPW